jgi:hypothetical protein
VVTTITILMDCMNLMIPMILMSLMLLGGGLDARNKGVYEEVPILLRFLLLLFWLGCELENCL